MVEAIRQGDIPGVQLRYRHIVAAVPQEIWDWLTKPELQRRWLADQSDPDRTLANALVLRRTDSDGQVLSESLVTVSADPPNRWTVDLQNLDGTWPRPTRVHFDLAVAEEGTEISILQTGFAHLPLSECLTIWETYRRRWRTALSSLADLL